MRLGLGQIIDYRKQLRDGGVNAIAVLVVSRVPARKDWGDVASEVEVLFSWPPFVELDERFDKERSGDDDGDNRVAASGPSG